MEVEERPSKIRKLENPEDQPSPQQAVALEEVSNDHNSHEIRQEYSLQELEQVIEAAKQSSSNNAPDNGETTVETTALSKNQQKKIKKRQVWEAKQPERKAKRKEQRKQKKQRERARRANEDESARSQRLARKDGRVLPITVVFDCDYDDLMNEKEIISLASQLTRCYSENRNAIFKARLAISSFSGRLRERFDTVLEGAYKSWHGVTFSEHDFVGVSQNAASQMAAIGPEALAGAFKRAQVSADSAVPSESQVAANGETIYLSSDSDVTLTELKPYSTYIIDGLVDRNRYKGRCYKAAMDKGFKTARLPIGEYLEMSSRHILTTNHVLEIMLKWLELGDWGAAFTEVIPKRKGGVLKSEGTGEAPEQAECAIEVSDEGDSETSSVGSDHSVQPDT